MKWTNDYAANGNNLVSFFLKWTNFSNLQTEEVITYWKNIESSDAELFFAIDKSNECQGVFCEVKGAGFNLFIGNPNFDWSFSLSSLFNRNISFVTTSEISNKLDLKFKISQHGLIGLTTTPTHLENSEHFLSFESFHQDKVSEVSIFLQNHYPKLYLDLYYTDNNFSNLKNFTNHSDKWGYLAYFKGELVGYVSYFSSTIPLLGQKCAFVADLVIHEEMRGRGHAYFLQSNAYKILINNKIKWILGSIFPENIASIKQAKKLGRENLINLVDFSNIPK